MRGGRWIGSAAGRIARFTGEGRLDRLLQRGRRRRNGDALDPRWSARAGDETDRHAVCLAPDGRAGGKRVTNGFVYRSTLREKLVVVYTIASQPVSLGRKRPSQDVTTDVTCRCACRYVCTVCALR